MLSLLKKMFIGLFLFFTVAILIGWYVGENRTYFLSIANPGKDPATVKITGWDKPITVGAGQDLTVEITGQNDASIQDDEHTITVERAGKTETFKSKLGGERSTLIVDVAGGSCIVWADVGGMYAGDRLPKGEAPVKIIKSFSGERVYVPRNFSKMWGREVPYFGHHRLGDPLPKSIKVSRSSTSVPSLERLIRVPCEVQGIELLKLVSDQGSPASP